MAGTPAQGGQQQNNTTGVDVFSRKLQKKGKCDRPRKSWNDVSIDDEHNIDITNHERRLVTKLQVNGIVD